MGFSVDALPSTDVAIHAGLKGTVEGPLRLRYSISGGVMPGPYLDLINTVCTGFGWYDDATADLISAALQNSIVIRNHVGWRPFPKRGFQFELGYGLITLGGGLSGSEVIAAATGEDMPDDLDETFSFSVAATLHMADVTVGWEWLLWKRIVLRADLGGAFTLGSNTVVEQDFEELNRFVQPAVDDFEDWAETYLDDTFTSYVHTPTIGVAVGYRFK
jgi:hypothetical protein